MTIATETTMIALKSRIANYQDLKRDALKSWKSLDRDASAAYKSGDIGLGRHLDNAANMAWKLAVLRDDSINNLKRQLGTLKAKYGAVIAA